MTGVMLAAQTSGPFDLTIVQRPLPQVGPGEALVEIEYVGLCGSDISYFKGTNPYARYPRIQGHEAVGVVRHAPSDGRCAAGERVVIDPCIACGRCAACDRGRPNCCANLTVLGVQADGALQQVLAIPAQNLHPLNGLRPEIGILAEPMSVALHAVARAGVSPGDHVAVVGAGPIGLLTAYCAKLAGATVTVTDRWPERLELANRIGIDRTVPLAQLPTADQVEGSPDAPLIVFETTGSGERLQYAAAAVRSTGTVVVIGVSLELATLPVADFTRKELSVIGSRNSVGQFPAALELLRESGEELACLVTHRIPLREAADAFERVRRDRDTAMKVLIRVGDCVPEHEGM